MNKKVEISISDDNMILNWYYIVPKYISFFTFAAALFLIGLALYLYPKHCLFEYCGSGRFAPSMLDYLCFCMISLSILTYCIFFSVCSILVSLYKETDIFNYQEYNIFGKKIKNIQLPNSSINDFNLKSYNYGIVIEINFKNGKTMVLPYIFVDCEIALSLVSTLKNSFKEQE